MRSFWRLLTLAAAALGGWAWPAAVPAVEKQAHGVLVRLDAGALRLEVWSDRVVRVTYAQGAEIPLHYFANFPRYLPNDFKVKSEHNRGLDWPISYADVAPYYDKVAAELGVSGDAKSEEIWRPKGAPYPM